MFLYIASFDRQLAELISVFQREHSHTFEVSQ